MKAPVLAAVLVAAHALAAHGAETCFERLAATRSFTLGAPQHAVPLPDGKSVLFLRSGPRDTKLHLYLYDLAAKTARELARPDDAPEHLSVEEKARRERARMTMTGITGFTVAEDGRAALVEEAGKLLLLSLPDGRVQALPGEGWIAPRLSRDGRFVAAVRGDDLHVIDPATGADRALTTGGHETLTRGLPEFAASEELEREDGAWWSPDGATLLYEEADTSGVERHFIADPEHPSVPPVEFRYPRAGTANARVRLGLIARDGGATRWVRWDSAAFPYLVRVVWPRAGKLSLVVMNRAETEQRVLAVDPATGEAATLLAEHDPAWIDIAPFPDTRTEGPRALPHWLADGSGFLWASERTGTWRLELRHADGSLDHVVTPDGLPFLSLEDVDPAGTVTFAANPDRLAREILRMPIAPGGAPQAIAAEPGLHDAHFAEGGHAVFTDAFAGADGTAETRVRAADGGVLATLPSIAETPGALPRVAFTTAGARHFDALVLHPSDFRPGTRYPVVLSVYAGPTVKMVERAPRAYFEDQCLADRGFVVVSVDGRGTPGRGRDWLRAVKGNLIDTALADQVEGLRALAVTHPEMDLARAGVTGWSFGGYFTAMATIRRPDVFAAGVAGAPVVDWDDYDTAYTERYLGEPVAAPGAYRASNVLTYAGQLARPLLLMHGLTDDNVYFGNTVKLTQALISAGKPYDLLLLPGTHLLPDPVLRARVSQARADFLAAKLGGPTR